MRLLVIHSRGTLAGGADSVFLNGSRLLADRGHQVACLTAGPCPLAETLGWPHYALGGHDDTKSLDRVAGFVYSRQAHWLAGNALREFRPDVVHAHIIHGSLSPAVLLPFVEQGIPIVQTLHDYHLICPVNTFVSKGQVCEACRGRRYYRALLKRCRRNSLPGSAAFALGAYLNDYVYHYDRFIARFITPSDFLCQKMISYGYPAHKFVTLPNAAYDPQPKLGDEPREHLLYAGRLAAHKGVDLLIRAAAGLELPVVIAGDGPERGRLEALARELPAGRVRFTGFLGRAGLAGLYHRARLSVLPSRWYENGPLAVFEAYANAVPVVGARIGALPEWIEDGRTGALFRPDDAGDLQSVLQHCLEDPEKLEEMGATAWKRAQSRYAPDTYTTGLERILAEACAEHHGNP